MKMAKDGIRDPELARLALTGSPTEAERAVAKYLKKSVGVEPKSKGVREMVREARRNAK